MQIRILVTGGTFDKEYDELTGQLYFRDTHLQEMLRRGRARLELAIETVMMIDSLEMNDAGRAAIVARCREAAERAIVVTHGTDTMVETARALAAADLGAINLSQGFPDFDCDPALVEAVARHMRAGRNQYAPMQGVPALRHAIAAKYNALYGSGYDGDSEVTVTSGGTEAIFDAVACVIRPGDEVIVFEPCYDSYVPAIELNG